MSTRSFASAVNRTAAAGTAGGARDHTAGAPTVGKRTLVEQAMPGELAAAPHAARAPASVPAAAPTSGGGAALPADVRAKMEAAFGASFAAVRIHQDGQAEALG